MKNYMKSFLFYIGIFILFMCSVLYNQIWTSRLFIFLTWLCVLISVFGFLVIGYVYNILISFSDLEAKSFKLTYERKTKELNNHITSIIKMNNNINNIKFCIFIKVILLIFCISFGWWMCVVLWLLNIIFSIGIYYFISQSKDVCKKIKFKLDKYIINV